MPTTEFPPLVRAAPAVDAIFSDSDASSSGGEEPAERLAVAEDSVFSAYLQASGASSGQDLAKIRSFLGSSRKSSFVACLICLERIRPSDPAWSCSSGCYDLFHLICIQSWVELPAEPDPRIYYCYCGKVENPPPDPWIVPHSCGEICGRSLRGDCGHHCLLLCHPGPCPPCPKLVTTRCFCGFTKDVRRCALKEFSCNRPCGKLLGCKTHRCTEKCHEGPCPPCRVKGTYRCLCGREEAERECCERLFQCEKPCGGFLICGKHACTRGCHAGPCGDCPLQGKRTCPCGKRYHEGVACDAIVPACGSTCEKFLSCNIHRCPERCHQGPCVESCRNVLVKFCRCGGLRKEVPCFQDLICERKCQKLRDCGRHACKRRCCDGNCLPCQRCRLHSFPIFPSCICGRKLRCDNHKCPSPCHRGICAPCPLMVSISCACGETHFELGSLWNRKRTEAPRCPKPCDATRLCRHSSTVKPHRCHYGACPPCRMICEEKLSCGHTCKLSATPKQDFSLRARKKKQGKPAQTTPGSACPPCQEVVLRSCLGKHIGEDRAMLCSSQVRFSCQNLCGNALDCGNHYCTKSCHALKPSLPSAAIDIGGAQAADDVPLGLTEPCEQCRLPCQKKPCLPTSMPSTMPPQRLSSCKVLVKRSCHCSSLVHVFECIYYNSLSADEQQRIRSCGGPCHRKLPNCPHLCSEICHPGHAHPSTTATVRCACGNLREEWVCRTVQDALRGSGQDPKDVPRSQFGLRILQCNSDCASKVKTIEPELLPRRSKMAESSAAGEDHVRKRRKRPERVKVDPRTSRSHVIKAALWKCLLLVLALALTLAAIYYGYKGLFRLSDWMDEIDSRHQRRRVGHPKV
ncbi:unnamed protein product [Spirodela intermedia]|uniref:NF-X1-type domain-containing protein n=1 Tax=Spirodela intermedia TaxID=51605 RepID=A0A7I8ICJ1_SPIIN|nr:unnamed protein product [Spirodela intermedia]CAA6654762.1 unnamed protein product [Spirodela intermedia]